MQGQKREVEEKVRSAEAEVFKAQEEAQKAKGEAENYKAHRSTANKLCASAQNDAVAWKSKPDAIAANFEEMRQAAMVRKAKRNKLRMSLNSVPGAQGRVWLATRVGVC
jgi:chromosome segregation ATPase